MKIYERKFFTAGENKSLKEILSRQRQTSHVPRQEKRKDENAPMPHPLYLRFLL